MFKWSLVLLILVGGVAPAFAAEAIANGVIVSTSVDKQAVTIRNADTGKRHTYFFNEKTKVTSNGEPLSFEQIAPGQAVVMDFTRTNLGREVNFIRIPELDQLLELEPIDTEQEFYASGVVVGVRASKRTVTIHGPRLSQRLTLHVPTSVTITKDTAPIKLGSIKIGDTIELRYHESAEGFVIVAAELSKPVPPKPAL